MAKDTVYYWNDSTMSLGAKIKEGDVIPAKYIKDNPEKFKALCDSKQISDKKKVKFEEKKHKELNDLHGKVSKQKLRIDDLLKSKGKLEKKILDLEADMGDIENLESIKTELAEIQEEKKLSDASKVESQKKIVSFSSKLKEAFGKSSISKDDKTSLLTELEELSKPEGE